MGTTSEFWALRISPHGTRRLKTAASTRVVPPHPLLVELGFLEYAKWLKTTGQTRLFPDLARCADERYGSSYSKRFARLLDALGITSDKIVFHSLRHTFATVMRNVTGNPDLVDRLMGHSRRGGSETDERYMKQVFPSIAYAAIKQLNYGLRALGQAPNGVTHLISTPVSFVDGED
jgi:integrase